MKSRFYLQTITLFILLGTILCAQASPKQVIHLAIFDNSSIFAQNNKFSANIQNSYLAGVKTAQFLAAKSGFTINYKPFFYGNNWLAAANMVSEVKNWQPDIIVGLHNTESFMMMRNYFSDLMVISLYASDYNLKKMPSNFFSIVSPDEEIAAVFPKFVTEKFQNHNIFLAVAADSKENEDMAFLIKKVVNEKYPQLKITEAEFIQEEIPNLNLNKLLINYHQNDIIIILCEDYYPGAMLMSRISQYYAPHQPIFISDFDNWAGNRVPTHKLYPFTGYRITPYLTNPVSKNYQLFAQTYLKIFHKNPTDQVSYQTFIAIMSFIEALKKYPAPSKLTIREKIMQSYKTAVSKNPDWYHQNRIYVYKMTPGIEELTPYSYALPS